MTELTTVNDQTILELAHELGARFEERSTNHDNNDTFVEENYRDLKENRIFSAQVPEELGGFGISHKAMCDFIRIIGSYCSSTALALSMHQHLIAANVWKFKRGQGGEGMLQKVADQQLVLISTGARDWLESNGEMKKVEGGYRVTARKVFASQSAIGDVIVTSAPFNHPDNGAQVLHFPVPTNSEGVTIKDDWYTMGMRGTGSCTIQMENVFVPDSAIVLTRPQGEFHPFWNVVLTVAMPLIMSAYVGVAEKAATMAIKAARKSTKETNYKASSVAEMNNDLTIAQVMHKDMVSITNNFDFDPTNDKSHEILTRKTTVSKYCISTVTKAMHVVGGQSYFRKFGIEKLFRDVQASAYHPLQEKDQLEFSGAYLLSEDS